MPRYSVIVPVYNRPQEVDELLQSLTSQSFKDFEVIIVEDGSSQRCESVVDKYSGSLSIQYLFKPNSGPGPSRNFGYKMAKGEYMVVFDSDCIIPPEYFDAVEDELRKNNIDAWGGPDRAHENFTLLQRAMGYTMASVLTTGGIRGGKKSVGWFQPRSFNMGISRNVFKKTGGFHFDRYAEDIEFSIRMKNAGFNVVLIEQAFVFHKRRTTFKQFFNQVKNFGMGRALIGKLYPQEVKITHWFPTLFTLGLFITPMVFFISPTLSGIGAAAYLFYFFAIFFDAWRGNGLLVAVLSIPSALLQLTGYGLGFLKEYVKASKV
jgi:glycosyltransferase involved in cell wall biosynthesis